MTEYRHLIRDVPDWPELGIVFKDITPLLASPEGMAWAVDRLYEPFAGKHIDLVAGIESRGFLFGIGAAVLIELEFLSGAERVPYAVHSVLRY